jgi:phospholipase/lecithinase/hemolysin
MFFLAVLLSLFLTATTGHAFTALYAFGDSLSDTGRNPAGTNYYMGRFSNGPLWVEYLSTNLGFSYNPSNNFAVAGSTSSNLLIQVTGVPVSSNLRSALFTIESGGNDFIENVDLGSNDVAWAAVISNAVVNVTNTVGILYADGAREFLVGNLLYLSQTPFFDGFTPDEDAYADSKEALYNSQLASALTNLMQQAPGLRVYLADFNQQHTSIMTSPDAYGFTVSSIGALQDTNLSDKSFTGPGADYVYWDSIHPTTKGHALLAALAFQAVGVRLQVGRSGTNMNLTISNIYPSLSYTIQRSTNLTTWSNYQSFTAAGTNATMDLTNLPATKSFYRVGY